MRCGYCKFTSESAKEMIKHSLQKHGATWNPPHQSVFDEILKRPLPKVSPLEEEVIVEADRVCEEPYQECFHVNFGEDCEENCVMYKECLKLVKS